MFKFYNHASFLLDDILVDPWFSDSVFLSSWDLLSELKYNINAINFNYLFISHEHPDHFHIPTLRTINNPESKTVIFHKTIDGKVLKFIKEMGFKTLECANSEYQDLNFGKLRVESNGFDSFFVYKKKSGGTYVNLNDYQVVDEKDLTKLQITNVDFLLSQFTYANWAGNKGDNQTPKRAQRIIYDRLSTQFKILKPKKWIPFASYNYFSHEENFHMNQYVPTMSDIKSFADSKKIDYYFPQPDTYYDERLSSVGVQYFTTMKKMVKPKHKNNPKPFDDVKESFQKMCDDIHYYNDMTLFDAEETYVKVSDWNCIIKYDIKSRNFERVEQSNYDIALSSECFDFMIKNKWGRGTVMISGRCELNLETVNRFFNQTNLWYNNNIGKYLGKNLQLKEIVNQDNFYNRLISDL